MLLIENVSEKGGFDLNASALILMITVQVTVTAFTVYFFWKVLKTPAKGFEEHPEDPDEMPF